MKTYSLIFFLTVTKNFIVLLALISDPKTGHLHCTC